MIDISSVPTDELIREILKRFNSNLYADNRQSFELLADELYPYMDGGNDD